MKMRVLSGVIMLPLALLLVSCESTRESDPSEITDQLGWWPTQAVPQPIEDPREDMQGRWWWPTDPGRETSPLWGNRGYVYVLKWSKVKDDQKLPTELNVGMKDIEGLVLTENVLFDFDKSEIKPSGAEVLRGVAAKLKEFPDVTVTIEGHTCSIGTEVYNMALGKRRAESVKQFLVSEGIAPERLEAVSYGETMLKVPERHAEDFAQNRRVEFEVHEGQE